MTSSTRFREDYFEWFHSGVEYDTCLVCGQPDPSRCEHDRRSESLEVERDCVLCGTLTVGPGEWCRACQKSDPFIQKEEYTP